MMAVKLGQDQYYQVKSLCRYEEKVKGSRFIATAKPVTTEAEANAFIEDIKKEFHDATHNCYAWKVGVGRSQRYRYYDDGEPSGTAGLPILKSIDARGVANACIVVTRYFGGTKLGTGGLMRAYGKMAADLLRSCEIEKRFFTESLVFESEFDFINVVHNVINTFEAELKGANYGENVVTFSVEVKASQLTAFKTKLTDATNGQVRFR
ncbi:MAG: YigZ family protein [candidate division Zixibacteria bacterium RBG_16_53_22]|nr:MAG: YigZ family protein [candidate division Zixibacteria bacterium RBG_16_53_22]